MAVNSSRSMNEEFDQGSVDSTYMQLTPGRCCVENPPIERYGWPRWQNVDQFPESPFLESHIRRAGNPREFTNTGDSDSRF